MGVRPMPETEPLWQQLISDNFTAILVLLGVIIAQIGATIVPRVRGRLEKEKVLREHRTRALDRWRSEIDKLFPSIGPDFQDTSTYSEIRPLLPAELRKEIEQGRDPNMVVVSLMADWSGSVKGESKKQKLLNELVRIEREEWKLL